MKSLLLAILLFNSIPGTDDFFICDSSNSIRYRLKANCRGLSNCSRRIIAVTLEKAKEHAFDALQVGAVILGPVSRARENYATF